MGGKLLDQEIEKYLKSIKMLSSSEIRDLVIEYKETKSKDTLAKIIEQNMRLIYQIASKYVYKVGMFDICDLIQEGVGGVIRAIDGFDPDKDYMFSTYAYWWIEQRIQRFSLKEKNYYSGSVHSLQRLQKLRKIKTEKNINGDQNLTLNDIMTELNVNKATAHEYLNASQPMLYLNKEIGNVSEDDTSELIDLLEYNTEEDPYELVSNVDFKNYMIDILKKYLKEKEFDVITKRYGFFGEPMTLQEIGDQYGLSRERVRQIESTAIRKLRLKKAFHEYKTFM